nr:hypothetical protein [Tanacetum cinerariifolium]
MLHICPRILGQAFAELPFKEEILEFIRFLGHGATIRTLTDVNINKLYQPWRSFAAIINKCLIGKSSGYDSIWLSQAQILWGLYHTRSIDYAFLIWEDFVYQVEHKNQKKSNKMYYPRFIKYGAMLPIELTNDEIKNTKAYKEYYAFATGEAAPKPKASPRRKRSGSDTSITPPTATTTPTTTVAVTPKLTVAAKGKQPAKAKSPSNPSEVARTEAQQLKIVHKRSRQQTDDDNQDQEIAKHDDKDDTKESGDVDEEGESDKEDDNEETRDEESFDPILQTPESSKDESEGEEDQEC